MFKKLLSFAILVCLAVVITVTGSIQGSQAVPGFAGDTGTLLLAAGGSSSINPIVNPNLPPLTIATPTPKPALNPGVAWNTTLSPSQTLNNTNFAHITDGFLTTSPLLYVIGGKNITVIEADTNKIVDVIYLDKYMLMDAVVTPDYKKLYVLYHDMVDPSRVGAGYQSDYANFILTIDLETKQIIDDTWYRDYPQYVIGSANDLVLSPDGRYLYYGNNQKDAAILFEYDTVLHKYTRGVITNEYYGKIKDEDSNIYDLTLTRDGKRLYFADPSNGKLTFVNLQDLWINKWIRPGVTDFFPWTAAVSADGNAAYVAGQSYYMGGYYLISMDIPAIEAKEQNAGSAEKSSILIDVVRLGPDGKSLYVLQPKEKLVVGYNIDTHIDNPALYWTYPTGNMPEDFVFSNDGTRIYIYSYGNNYVSVRDLYSRQQLSGSPVTLGKDWGIDQDWSMGGKHKMVMGPDPQGNIFVNDSAYRAQKMLKLASMIQTPSVSHMSGALDLNKSSPGSSSFYFDHSLGKIVYVNFSGPGATAKPTIVPGYDLSFSGAITIRPFPGQAGATPGQENNQTPSQSPQSTTNATATQGSNGNNSNPGASVTTTPGFEAVVCLACLAIAMLTARRKK